MSSTWVPGRGFVPAGPQRDAGGSVQGVLGGLRAKRGQSQPGNAPASQQNPNGGGSGHHTPSHPAGGYTEAYRHTVGKPWKPYAELTGMGMDYDRSQYHFPEVAVRNRSSGRSRNVNRGAGSEAEKQGAQGGQGDHFDPLARQFDMRPPEAIEAGPQRGRLNAGDQPLGALGSGPRVHASYERTPRVIPAGAQGWVEPFGALGMGSQPRTAAASPKAGMAQSGMLRARRNIIAPEQGSTPASMSSSNVLDVPSWEK